MVTDRLCRCANKNPWERERWTELNPFVPFKEFFPMAIYLFSGNGVLANSRLHYLAQRIIGVTIATKNVPSSSLDFSRGDTRKKWRITFGRADALKMRESFYFVSPLWEKKERKNGGGASFRLQQRQRIDSENSGPHCHPNRPQCGPTKKREKVFLGLWRGRQSVAKKVLQRIKKRKTCREKWKVPSKQERKLFRQLYNEMPTKKVVTRESQNS